MSNDVQMQACMMHIINNLEYLNQFCVHNVRQFLLKRNDLMDGDVYNKLIITNARYIKKVYFSIYLYICNNWFIIYIIQPDMDYHHE